MKTRPTITQAVLRELNELRVRERAVRETIKACREQIIELDAAGASLEVGPLEYELEPRTRGILSQQAIREALGEPELQRLLRLVGPTREVRVVIHERRVQPAVDPFSLLEGGLE